MFNVQFKVITPSGCQTVDWKFHASVETIPKVGEKVAFYIPILNIYKFISKLIPILIRRHEHDVTYKEVCSNKNDWFLNFEVIQVHRLYTDTDHSTIPKLTETIAITLTATSISQGNQILDYGKKYSVNT